jgi:hypothetical protein
VPIIGTLGGGMIATNVPLRIERMIRKVAKALRCDIHISEEGGVTIRTFDLELHGRMFVQYLGSPSNWERAIQHFHEHIYHERAKEKHRQQGGKCASCGKHLGNLGECDHINGRAGARGGRDDRLSNLQIVCPPFSGGCDFHQRKHGH